MIGSPDVVAFTKEDDFGELYPDPYVLPEEFSVPLFTHATNPWTKTTYAKFSKDFILISEFSEQVGPQPLLTIPDDSKVCGTFDLNYFSLRIMSVDYQASFVGHPPGSNYPKLNFVEDSKVVLGDSKEGAFAYVHHLTLYDLEARGFVRPFCMAYISADERKIMQQFQKLSSEFSRASECLKCGNRKAFANELLKKLKDLEYTRSVVHKEAELQKMNNGCYSTQAIEKANELANVEKSIYEHKDLLRQITSYPSRKRKDPECVAFEPEKPTDTTDVDLALSSIPSDLEDKTAAGDETDQKPSYTPQLIKAKSAKCFDKRLKTLEELCESTFFHQTMDQLKLIERSFRGDLCYIYTSQIDRALVRRQKVTNFLFEEEEGWQEEGPTKQYEAAGLPVVNQPPSVSDMCAEPMSLESYSSCLDTIQIKTEPELAEGPPESSPSDFTQETSEEAADTETKGSFSSDRSIEAISPGNLQMQYQDTVEVGTNAGIEECTPIADSAFLDQDAADFSSAYYELPSVQTETDGGVGTFPLLENDTAMNHAAVMYQTGSIVQVDTACCMGQEGFISEEPLSKPPHDGCGDTVVKHEPLSLLQRDPAIQGDYVLGEPALESPSTGLSLPELNSNTLSEEMARINVEDASDTTSYMSTSTSSDRAPSPFCHGNPVTLKQKKRAGQSTLKFIRQYPFAQQAIFCLLSGRTLVVLGVEEGTVRKLVNALSIFVPNLGKYGETVQPWLSTPFQLTDLHRWKLIGLQRMASPTGSSILHSLSRYSRYIGILDTDNKTMRCPPYKGTLLGHMADHRTQIKRGSTYFLHVQSMLTQLTAKAFLFTFCHHLHLPVGSEDEDSVVARRTSFLHHLGYSEEESKIVHFLSELIKQHYIQGPSKGASQSVLRFNYTTSYLYKI
ncbi:guanine nucleotide exchange protein smcr8a [Sardina pilchardus]|uniref:guanine nucleotide exchange protein smcr8a n=1 Tax=Sardina pilchardus TaxID=27697 RepID=UPI002E134332